MRNDQHVGAPPIVIEDLVWVKTAEDFRAEGRLDLIRQIDHVAVAHGRAGFIALENYEAPGEVMFADLLLAVLPAACQTGALVSDRHEIEQTYLATIVIAFVQRPAGNTLRPAFLAEILDLRVHHVMFALRVQVPPK